MKVDSSSFVSSFHDFFTTIYKQKLDSLLLVYPSQKSLYVDYLDLEKFDPDLADQIMKEPDIALEAAEEAVRQLNLTVPSGGDFTPHVRIANVPDYDLLIEKISSARIN